MTVKCSSGYWKGEATARAKLPRKKVNEDRENCTFKMSDSSGHFVIAVPSTSVQSERSRCSLAAVREELEVARQEAAQALDCLCAERESRAQDALQLKDAVPLSKHKEALSAVSEQLAQTLQELQEEKSLRGQAEERAAGLETRLQAAQDSIPREEHENIKVCRHHVAAGSTGMLRRIFFARILLEKSFTLP